MTKRNKKKSKKGGGEKVVAAQRHHVPSTDVASLVANAEAALSQMQIESALNFYEQALKLDSLNCNIMESLADIYLSLGEGNRALELLLESSRLSPDSNPEKYLYIAQLQEGEEALASYNQAIHLLSLSRVNNEDNNESALYALNNQLIKSYCGVADLYLTDLCFNDDAEQHCQEAITAALNIDADSVDANHALANIRLSQNNPGDAAIIVEKVYTRIREVRSRINSRSILEDLHAPEHIDFRECVVEEIPGLDVCISTVKLMVECSTIKPILAEEALDFAAELLNDNDENIELWYIAGVAAISTVPPDPSVALHYFESAKCMIDSMKELPHFKDGAMDEQYALLEDHITMARLQHQQQSNTLGCLDSKTGAVAEEEWSSDEGKFRQRMMTSALTFLSLVTTGFNYIYSSSCAMSPPPVRLFQAGYGSSSGPIR